MRIALLLVGIFLLGIGCAEQTNVPFPQGVNVPVQADEPSAKEVKERMVVLPVAEYGSRRTLKAFGEYIEDRFRGYHAGDDIEYGDVAKEVPVVAIADGVVERVSNFTGGYGGVLVLRHEVAGRSLRAIYGHLDLKESALVEGGRVSKGALLANLGDGETRETDGERKHLHFALYEGDGIRVNGYEPAAAGLDRWLNPSVFFEERGHAIAAPSRTYNSEKDRGGDIFRISFRIPEGMEVEYVPSIRALNIFTISGRGSARKRSQIFIRYFDATSFLTLPTVTIHGATDTTVGQEEYVARRYEIEKKPGVPDFPDQPAWRNGRHFVTDFRLKEGPTRYYVVAANPNLDSSIYDDVLESMAIRE